MRVPRYDEPQVEVAPAPTIRLNPADYTGRTTQLADTAQALGTAGDAIGNAAIRMQERTDADKVFSAEAAASNDARDFETQALSQQGQNAWGIHDQGKQFWDKTQAKYADSLTSDRQRKLFAQSVMRMRDSSLDRLATHEAQQRRASLEDSANASIVGIVNSAAADPTPENINGARDAILKRRQVVSQLNGETPDVKELKDAEAVSNLHLQVLDRLVDSDPTAAQSYFDEHKAEISGGKLATVERALKAGTLKTVAQKAADEIDAAGLNEEQALKKVRAQYSGEEEAAAVEEVTRRFSERRTIREQDQKDAGDEAQRLINNGSTWDQIPASLIARMDPKTVAGMKAGKDVTTNWDTYYALRGRAKADPDSFKSLDLRPYFTQLAPTERRDLIDLQGKSADEMKDVATLDQQLAEVHTLLGWGKDDGDKKGAFDRAVMDAIDAEQKRSGKKLGYAERRDLIDSMLIDGTIPGTGIFGSDYFATSGQRYQFAGTPQAQQFLPTRDAVIKRFTQRKGRAPTEDEIAKVYANLQAP